MMQMACQDLRVHHDVSGGTGMWWDSQVCGVA